MALFIHDGGILGLAAVDTATAEEAKKRFLSEFPNRYYAPDGNLFKWVNNWLPHQQPAGEPFFIDGRARLSSEYDRKGLKE